MFANDATSKLDWRSFMGIYLVITIGRYVERSNHLSDLAFIALCVLQALFIYGPTADLQNYFKGIFGGFKVPESQTVVQNNAGDGSTVNGPAVAQEADINSATPNPHST